MLSEFLSLHTNALGTVIVCSMMKSLRTFPYPFIISFPTRNKRAPKFPFQIPIPSIHTFDSDQGLRGLLKLTTIRFEVYGIEDPTLFPADQRDVEKAKDILKGLKGNQSGTDVVEMSVEITFRMPGKTEVVVINI